MTRERILWIALICAVFLAWRYTLPVPAPVGTFVAASIPKEIKDVKKEDVAVKKIRAYPAASKAKMGLPAPEQQADNIYLVGAAKLSTDLHPRTVTTVYDSDTGEVRQEVRIDPYPLIAPEQRGEVRMDYGMKINGSRVGRITLREDVLQVKAMHIGATATLDTDGDAFVGVGVGYRW